MRQKHIKLFESWSEYDGVNPTYRNFVNTLFKINSNEHVNIAVADVDDNHEAIFTIGLDKFEYRDNAAVYVGGEHKDWSYPQAFVDANSGMSEEELKGKFANLIENDIKEGVYSFIRFSIDSAVRKAESAYAIERESMEYVDEDDYEDDYRY